MTPRGSGVHACRCHHSVLASCIHDVHHFISAGHVHLCCVLHVNTSGLVVFHLQVRLLRVKQVLDFLHVNFEVATLDVEFDVWVGFSDPFKQVIEHSRDNTLQISVFSNSFHSKRFPTACLSICENSSVVAIHDPFNDRAGNLVEDLLLL